MPPILERGCRCGFDEAVTSFFWIEVFETRGQLFFRVWQRLRPHGPINVRAPHLGAKPWADLASVERASAPP